MISRTKPSTGVVSPRGTIIKGHHANESGAHPGKKFGVGMGKNWCQFLVSLHNECSILVIVNQYSDYA